MTTWILEYVPERTGIAIDFLAIHSWQALCSEKAIYKVLVGNDDE